MTLYEIVRKKNLFPCNTSVPIHILLITSVSRLSGMDTSSMN